MKSALIFATTIALAATPAFAGPDRVSILMGSQHINPSVDFNEINPGIFLTWENEVFDYSVGVYHNSFGRVSVAATAALPVIEWKDGEAALFGGVAYYPQDGRTFAVHAGDFVPVGGLQVRHKNLFAQVIPSDGYTADAIISVGMTFEINP